MIVTAEWIEENKTPAGGWTAKQLRCIGVAWPPPKGWKERAIGRDISEAERAGFEVEKPEPTPIVEVTSEWLDSVSDEQGLTKGQKTLLDIWCKSTPYVGKTIPVFVARFIGQCRGYRGMSQALKDWLAV